MLAETLVILSSILAQAGDRPGEAQKELPAALKELPPPPPLSPADQATTFQIQDGFSVELVASEPVVRAPVAMRFDEDGRLWVVEMSGYMRDVAATGEREPLGRIVVLADNDHNGTFETSTVFADGLVLPRAVLPIHGHALVIAPPNLLLLHDDDHDGIADRREVLLEGLGGLENPEHAANGLLPSLDNWIYLANHGVRVQLRGSHVAIEPVPGHGQWGITEDDEGRLYYTPNSEALRCDIVPKVYQTRSIRTPLAGVDELVCTDQRVWPIHPTPGVNRGYQDGFLRPDGTLANLTAACGPVIYRETSFGEDFAGDAFVCEPAANLLKHLDLRVNDSGIPHARPAREGAEFLASTDERFRPVNLEVGPDGALYIADMYRGVIQHRLYMTSFLRAQVTSRKLEAPVDMGRIWRVTRQADNMPAPRSNWKDREQTIAALAHTSGWWRSAAQRVIVQGQMIDAAPALRVMATTHKFDLARLHALWTLEGLGALAAGDVVAALNDSSPRVRRAGCRLASSFIDDARVRAAVGALTLTNERVHAVLALGSSRDDAALDTIARAVAADPRNERLVSAAVNAAAERESALLERLLAAGTREPRVVASLIDGSLRSPDATQARTAINAGAREAQIGDRRVGAVLVARLSSITRSETTTPRSLELDAEPHDWLALLSAGVWDISGPAQRVDRFISWPGRPSLAGRPRALTDPEQALYSKGASLFATYCASCHAPSGAGTTGVYPPLAGSGRVHEPPHVLARVLFHGLEGPITSDGVRYNGVMVASPVQDDESIAALMTYVRRAWGNTADPITPARVRELRAAEPPRTKPWSTDELGRTPAPTGFTPLFDGATLSGWTQRGGAASYRAEDGCIVGETRPNTPNSFLCTEKSYTDFELVLDFLADEGLNSGIQIRSNSDPAYKNGQVHGYQVEIDTTERAWSGGLYDEGRRGWLNDLTKNDAARAAFRHRQWNTYRILCEGPRIRTWINDVAAADLADSMTPTGFIGLQVHDVGNRQEPMRIRWKNIRIREMK